MKFTSAALMMTTKLSSMASAQSTDSQWTELSKSEELSVVTPDMAALYQDAKRTWITSNEADAAAFIQPKSVEGVKEAIVFLRENGIRPMVQCGGHSFSSNATQTLGGVTIDLAQMGNVEVDSENLTATAYGCVLAQDVYDAVGPTGNAVIASPHGHVGYTGFLLGGGQSFRSRTEGLAIDKVLHFRIITGEGEELLVTPTENEDLFWALQGAGGGNFGVVVEIKFEIFPHEGNETWGTLQFPYANSEEASRIVQNYVNLHSTIDERLNFRLSDNAFNGGGSIFSADFAFFGGGTTEAEGILNEFLEEQMKVDISTVSIKSEEFDSLHVPSPYDGEEVWTIAGGRRAGSAYMGSISLETSQWIIDHFLDDSHPCKGTRHWAFTPCGAAVKEVENTATAFWGREAEMEIELSVGYDTVDEDNDKHCQDFINQVIEHMENDKETSYIGSYYNHVGDGFDDFATRFWGDNLEQLKVVKAQYDPDNFWVWQYSIPVEEIQAEEKQGEMSAASLTTSDVSYSGPPLVGTLDLLVGSIFLAFLTL